MDAKQESKQSESTSATATAERNDRTADQGANRSASGSTGASRTANANASAAANSRGDRQQSGQENRMARRDAYSPMSPFGLLQRFLLDDIAGLSLFDGSGSRSGRPRPGQETTDVTTWTPRIDVVQRDNELVVRADLPGVTPDDVTVELTDDAIIISGERQQERVDDSNGVYRVERMYGAFFREIPLPEGALVDQGKATFRDGVLEITVPAPPDQSRGRRLKIDASRETRDQREPQTARR